MQVEVTFFRGLTPSLAEGPKQLAGSTSANDGYTNKFVI